MFRDLPGLFAADGVPVDLVRAGEPRLRTYRGRDAFLPKAARAAVRAPRLRRALRPATSS